MCSRVLGHLILEAPTELGRDWVCKKILNCPDEYALARLAQKYIFTFFGAFKASAGRSLSYIVGSSLSTPNEGGISFLADYEEKRMLALERDAYRCMITGALDSVSAPEALLAGVPLAATEATPIIPPSVDIRTFSRYASFSNDDPLCDPALSFYRLENILTLDGDMSDEFRSLNVWFEETNRDDEYEIVTWHPSTLPAPHRRCSTVTFTTTDPVTKPVPSSRYLRLHAACARAAHKSGAAAYIEALARDIARLTVLAEDGSSAGVLAAALSRIAAA
ncbi:hypothetical protein B0F90DRAFT_1340776 [Multifurca ochricompacta]|uniref:HNH nuclease domain-containing protein n=1 Tax=Multifurca ochricompacta TaxID=376703 RepID=A0AAD4LX96_9AGAM|nr:hypothetical protein B0F90DRAFT_1340776 [Multifurca ochricompacta]